MAEQTTARVARHYADGDALDTYDDCIVDIQRDGDDSVLVDVTNVPESEQDAHPWGRPGIGLELTVAEARDLAHAILKEIA